MTRLAMNLIALVLIFGALSGCLRYYKISVDRSDGMTHEVFEERFVVLSSRVLGEVEGVESIDWFETADANRYTLRIVYDGSRASKDVKAEINAIMIDLELIETPISMKLSD